MPSPEPLGKHSQESIDDELIRHEHFCCMSEASAFTDVIEQICIMKLLIYSLMKQDSGFQTIIKIIKVCGSICMQD